MINGWINLNKPKGFSSAYCLNVIKNKFKKIKIGHAGTLDPLAEGVLPIALGEATKTVSLIHLQLKSYLFEIKWGSETDTLDLEGKVINQNEIYPEKNQVQNILKKFIGWQMQIPPKFSAVKINGKRSYELARNNLLARDIARSLDGFSHVTQLIRTRYGSFRIKNSNSLEKLIEKESTDHFLKYVLDIQSALIHIPSIKLKDERINLIKNGMKVSLVNEFGKVSLDNIYTEALDKPLALGYLKSGFFYPKRVFN
ncbi:MAG: tRNA pseudouridine(55) synthase TruB [Candidatus Fonsibacter ubiquis]|nr:tRNA pseudouridine(55) synthase TruB [Candidatus Fonsibacter ubiquis]